MGTTASRILDLEWGFQYLSVDVARAAGISTSEVPDDADAWRLVHRISKHINMVTEQVFNPVYLEASVDGMGDRFLPSPHALPILQIDSLRPEPDGTSLDLSAYSVEDRAIQLRSLVGLSNHDLLSGSLTEPRFARRFKQEVDTATMSGWFGWVEGRIPRRAAARTGGRKYLKLAVATAIPAATSGMKGQEIEVDTVDGVKVGQTIAARLADVDEYLGLGLVTAVTPGTPSLTIDYLEEDLEVDDDLFIFPPPPGGIINAAQILASTPGHGIGAPVPGASVPGALPIGFALTEEKIDNYRWEASATSRAGDSPGTGARTSGVPAADALLQFYTRPARSYLV